MKTKDLEQVRAENALRCARESKSIQGKQGGKVINKIPPLVMNHGLLASAAFAANDGGHQEAWDWIARHLADPRIAIVPEDCTDCAGLLDHLTGDEADSTVLARATSEAMAWLSYARRFVREEA
jgi:CRISPR/Cas system CMR-associated protein Cmr5 small subunit